MGLQPINTADFLTRDCKVRPQMDSVQPNSHSCTDFWGLFCLLQAFPAFAQVSWEWGLAVQQDPTSHGAAMVENPGMQSGVQLLGEDKKVSVTI